MAEADRAVAEVHGFELTGDVRLLAGWWIGSGFDLVTVVLAEYPGSQEVFRGADGCARP